MGNVNSSCGCCFMPLKLTDDAENSEHTSTSDVDVEQLKDTNEIQSNVQQGELMEAR